jgi:Glycosyltransferase family 92
MSFLMTFYVIAICAVAFFHWPIKSAPSLASGGDSSTANRVSLFQQRWEQVKEERNLTATKEPPRKKNPFKMFNLGDPLTHGVKPDALLKTDEKVVAIKEDPDDHPTPEHVLTAYLEPLNFDDWKILPLPLRTTAKAEKLTKVQYTRLNSCSKLPQQFPIDDTPADTDSFLPWIHDVFPSADGRYIQIVAQNKRRCKSGSKEKHILAQQQPQAALFQHVSLKRIDPVNDDNGETRYRLTTHDEADPDAVATRFICRFQPDGTETVSEYNFDYDWTAYRKRYKVSFAEDDAGIKAIHTSQLIFRCPVPDHLVESVRSGETVHDDWASLFLDLIPIRTPPRFGPPDQYLQPIYKDFETTDPEMRFDPVTAWGENHILPKIDDSGRWENIPICKPSIMTYGEANTEEEVMDVEKNEPVKHHRLVSCIWASAGYTTRGNRFAINDGQRRLLEWITYNRLIGFDHVYLYDNSGAFGDEISLKPIADLFPDAVTYIPWPAQICNNNPNNVDSVGERSSQYAAESSCRLRFGPHVEWIGQFDIDEYLVPMGEYKQITELLDKLEEEDTKIISFASWRAWPRRAFVEEPVKIDDPDVCWHNEPCFDLQIPYEHPMLQAYNCDRQKPGKKTLAMPAEKQLYKPDYVLSHFVHYSVATVQSEQNKTEYTKNGYTWKRRAFPDPRQRFGDEITEGLMIHTKAVARQDTAGWERMCHINNTYLPVRRQGLCRLGVPYPDDWTPKVNGTEDGWAYNCYVNEKVENFLIPKLKAQLEKHANFFTVE